MAERGKTRVLCAAGAELDRRLQECLPGRELSFVRTMHEAVAALRHDGYRLLVIELAFDESRMFELLQHVRGLPKYREVPVICVYGDHLNLSDAVIRDIDVAVKALGGIGFVDLRDSPFAHDADCTQLGAMATQASFLPPN